MVATVQYDTLQCCTVHAVVIEIQTNKQTKQNKKLHKNITKKKIFYFDTLITVLASGWKKVYASNVLLDILTLFYCVDQARIFQQSLFGFGFLVWIK